MAKRYPTVTRVEKDPEDYEENVQIDLDDPMSERVMADGRSRLSLNKREKTLLAERMLVAKAVALIIEKGLSFAEAADQSGLGLNNMRSAITGEVYPEMKEIAIKHAIGRYLDLGEESFSEKKIADELGLTLRQYRDLRNSPLFKDMYNQAFSTLQNHPIINAVQTGLVDELLPKAYKTLDDILTNSKTSATVRLNAAKEVIRLSGIEPQQAGVSERHALTEFLSKHDMNIENFNVIVPELYRDAIQKYNVFQPADETVEGEVVELEE